MKLAIALGSLAVASLCAMPALADDAGSGWTFSLMGGSTVLDEDVTMENDFLGGGRIGYILHPYIHIEGMMHSMSASASDDPMAEDARLDHYGLELVLNALPGRLIDPYVAGGYARTDWRVPEGGFDYNGYQLGGGLRLLLAEGDGWRWDFRTDGRAVFSKVARGLVSDPKVRDDSQTNLLLTAGLQLSFGGTKDADGDGVTDKQDRCPDTPRGAAVDATGCPKDTDGDGVWDGLDECPNTQRGASVDARGCPKDSDGDGVFDGIDRCADTPKGAPVDFYGCAKDADGDGVHDGIDRCPTTPRGAPVDRYGCPKDADGDGVHDGIDRCPDTPRGVQVDARGCELTAMEQQMLNTGMIRLDTVHFHSGKAELKPESYPSLDEVGAILAKWDDLRIEIGGHTDSQGSAGMNEKLSGARAVAVRDYLLKRFSGIDAAQLDARGYGESQPIGDNNTARGRATNRRVEFKVLTKGTLSK